MDRFLKIFLDKSDEESYITSDQNYDPRPKKDSLKTTPLKSKLKKGLSKDLSKEYSEKNI